MARRGSCVSAACECHQRADAQTQREPSAAVAWCESSSGRESTHVRHPCRLDHHQSREFAMQVDRRSANGQLMPSPRSSKSTTNRGSTLRAAKHRKVIPMAASSSESGEATRPSKFDSSLGGST
jgi:hypothetical protein